MKPVSVLALICLSTSFTAAVMAQGRELRLGTATGSAGNVVSVPLTLTSDAQVQGLVSAFDWNGADLEGTDLVPGAALSGANVVVKRVQPAFAVLGVVMDNDGTGGEIIPPGTGVAIATLRVKCLGPAGDTDVVSPVTFKDQTYSMTVSGPLLDNIIVVGGLSIGSTEGLGLANGSVRCTPPPPGQFTIVSSTGFYGACVGVPVEMANSSEVQGFVTAVSHPAGITLNRILLGSAAAGADFQQPEIFATGGTLGVVMELDGNPPFRTIPLGSNNRIATYEYCSAPITDPAACTRPNETYQLSFVDNVLGDPVKENVIVVGGRSKNPDKVDGTLTLAVDTTKPPCFVPEEVDMSFAVGSCELVDDPNSDDKDQHIPGTIRMTRGTASRASCFQVGLYYRAPEDDEPDEAHQTDHLQGVSMALCFDPRCIECKETWSLTGTITEALGAEFVNVHCENDLTDGDPGELIVGILVDALPPFDGRELPPTNDYLRLICVDFCVNPEASCDNCASTAITFCDGADGRGRVPIRNLASVMNNSVVPSLEDGSGVITIVEEPAFIRGDCNGSDSGLIAVDISDAASVISFLFLTGSWKFQPPCLDACDANDDGRVDLADSVYILRYLFKFDRDPKAPFPDAGADPTADKLSCAAVVECPTTVP